MAIGAPGATVSGESGAGVVHVLYGSEGGLSSVGDQQWHQNVTGLAGVSEASDYFGESVETGDFDCDGYLDLVVGIPREDTSGKVDAGAVQVLYGSSGGITTVDDVWVRGSGGVDGVLESGDHFGASLAAGNFNGQLVLGNDCDDLAIGSPGEDLDRTWSRGGADSIEAGVGDDVVFGGPGKDTIDGGPGLDFQIRGEDDDVFIVDHGCEVGPGEVIDGGPGNGGHWLQSTISGDSSVGAFSYSYNPLDTPCEFGIRTDDLSDLPVGSSNLHGIRSAERSSGALIEGFAHFVAAVAFNKIEETGEFRYYKKIDPVSYPDYADFVAGEYRLALEGGGAGTLGGQSRWVETRCPNDWANPTREISSEIDWLRFFWQFLTSPSAPGPVPTFWEAAGLLKYTQANNPWTSDAVWSQLRSSVADPGSGLDSYLSRFDSLEASNGLNNQ